MAYALELLTVHELRDGAAVPLNATVRSRRSAPRRMQRLLRAPRPTAVVLAALGGTRRPHIGGCSSAADRTVPPHGMPSLRPSCASPPLPRPQALWQRLLQLRRDFFLLYLGYHHFRSKVGPRDCAPQRMP